MERITKTNTYHPCKHCHEPTNNLNRYCDCCQQYANNWKSYQDKFKNQNLKRIYQTSKWHKLRDIVKKRDDYICQECLRHGYYVTGSEVDHIIPISQGGSDSLDNLELLCVHCHRIKTQKESKIKHV